MSDLVIIKFNQNQSLICFNLFLQICINPLKSSKSDTGETARNTSQQSEIKLRIKISEEKSQLICYLERSLQSIFISFLFFSGQGLQ